MYLVTSAKCSCAVANLYSVSSGSSVLQHLHGLHHIPLCSILSLCLLELLLKLDLTIYTLVQILTHVDEFLVNPLFFALPFDESTGQDGTIGKIPRFEVVGGLRGHPIY